MAATATAVLTLASVLAERADLALELGETTAWPQFMAVVAEPTPDVVGRQNRIWVKVLFPKVVNRLLREYPDYQDDLQAVLRALAKTPRPLERGVDNSELFRSLWDTREEWRGDR